jgi:hypothetical protein
VYATIAASDIASDQASRLTNGQHLAVPHIRTVASMRSAAYGHR